jgi:sterol desaturase/sphingolipid hydroxylase (fatty acid hydroxylase superfamily)
MVLCELAAGHDLSPVALWLVLTALGLLSILPASGAVFYAQYVRRSYAQWRWKTLPAYPSAADVRLEVLATLKGIAAATVPPTLSIYLSARGYSQGYCGVEPHGYGYLLASFVLAFVASDCYEWAYHRLGHTSALGWAIHKHHHKFHNPSPFAVIADEPPDQFVRALPLLVMPLLMPTNMDMVRMCVCVCMCVSHASHNTQHTSPMHHTRTHTHTRTHAAVRDICGHLLRVRGVSPLWTRTRVSRRPPPNSQHIVPALHPPRPQCAQRALPHGLLLQDLGRHARGCAPRMRGAGPLVPMCQVCLLARSPAPSPLLFSAALFARCCACALPLVLRNHKLGASSPHLRAPFPPNVRTRACANAHTHERTLTHTHTITRAHTKQVNGRGRRMKS